MRKLVSPREPGRDEGKFYFVPKIAVITPTQDAPNMIPQQNNQGSAICMMYLLSFLLW